MASNPTDASVRKVGPTDADNETFNVLDLYPTSVEFWISTRDLEQAALEVFKQFSPDFQQVTVSLRGHNVMVYAWITKNSPDINDRSLVGNSKSYLQAPLEKDSAKIAELKNLYCYRDPATRQFIQAEEEEYRDMLALQISPYRLMSKFFDVSGRGYQKLMRNAGYAVDAPKPSRLHVDVTTNRDGHMTGFTVIKQPMGTGKSGRPTPKTSYKFD